MLYSGEPKKNEGQVLVIVKASFSQEPCVSRSVWIKTASQCNGTYVKRMVTNEDCLALHRTSKVRVSMARNYYHFKDLVVVSSINLWTSCGSSAEIWFGWLERILSPFCKTLKGINHTKANDASVIFQRITSLLVSQATSKVRKCLLNLWSTWHKYISLSETTSIRCFQIYLIQLYLINITSQLNKAVLWYIWFSCIW